MKDDSWAGEKAQLVKARAARPNDLSSILGPTWKTERTNPYKLSYDLHIRAVAQMCPYTYTQTFLKFITLSRF